MAPFLGLVSGKGSEQNSSGAGAAVLFRLWRAVPGITCLHMAHRRLELSVPELRRWAQPFGTKSFGLKCQEKTSVTGTP